MPTAEELAQSQSQSQLPAPDNSAEISNIVNAAVTAHLKRSLGKAIADAVAEAIKPVKEQFEAAKVQPAPEPAKAADPKASPEFAAVTRQLEEMKTKLEAESGARTAAEKRQREDRAYADLRAGLQAKGVKPEFVDVVARDLFHGQKRIEFDEAGTALYRHTKTTPGYGDEDELLPLSAGIEAFAKSKDAAAFMPAPTAPRAPNLPTRPQSRTAPTQPPVVGALATDDEKISNAMAREDALRAQFPNA